MVYIYVLYGGVSERLHGFLMKASFKVYSFKRVCCSLNRRGARSEPDRAKWRRLRLQRSPHLSGSPSSSREMRRDDRLRVNAGLAGTVGKRCADTCCFKRILLLKAPTLSQRTENYISQNIRGGHLQKKKSDRQERWVQIGFQMRKITSTHHAR